MTVLDKGHGMQLAQSSPHERFSSVLMQMMTYMLSPPEELPPLPNGRVAILHASHCSWQVRKSKDTSGLEPFAHVFETEGQHMLAVGAQGFKRGRAAFDDDEIEESDVEKIKPSRDRRARVEKVCNSV